MCIYMVSIEGTSPTLQDWRPEYGIVGDKGMFATHSGQLYEPAEHFEAVLLKAMGLGFVNDIYIGPRKILYGIEIPAMLTKDSAEAVYYAATPKKPAIKKGWQLYFDIAINCHRITEDMLEDSLARAGEDIGIGEWGPDYGQFSVVGFARMEALIRGGLPSQRSG